MAPLFARAGLPLLLVAAGCQDDRGNTVGGELDSAVLAMGGAVALNAVNTLVTKAVGVKLEPEEGFGVDEPRLSDFEYTLSEDFGRGGMRQEWMVQGDILRPVTFRFTEVALGQIGFVDGIDGFVTFSPQSPMPASRLLPRLKQQRLADPLVLVRKALQNPGDVTILPDAEFEGRLHDVIEIPDGVQPVRLFLDSVTHLPGKAETTERDPVFGDVVFEVIYVDYHRVGDVVLPFQLTYRLGGHVLRLEERLEITPNAPIAPGAFDVPPALVIPLDPVLAAWSDLISNWFMRMQSISFGLYQNLGAVVEISELAPKVFVVGGAGYDTLVIEMSDHLIVAEAPLYDERSQPVLAAIKARFPGKPIRDVIMTHHHMDHSGGVRGYAAETGVRVIAPQADVDFVKRMLAAPHTITPDALQVRPRQVEVVGVTSVTTLTDGTRQVQVVDIPTRHSEGMVGVFLPAERLFFVADLFNPGFIPPGQASPPGKKRDDSLDLFNALTARGIDTAIDRIAGVHGFGTGTVADVRAAAGL